MLPPSTSMPIPDSPSSTAITRQATHVLTTSMSAPPPSSGDIPAIQVTAPPNPPHTPALIGFQLPGHYTATAGGDPGYLVIDGVRYYRETSQATVTNLHPDQSPNSRLRFQRLVSELARACNNCHPTTEDQLDIVSSPTDPEEHLGTLLDRWNRKVIDMSGASTPQVAVFDETEADDDRSNKIKVTLIFNPIQANYIDAPLGGCKVFHIAQTKLERILGPDTMKAKIPEIRNGAVVLQDVFPTTFNAIRKWLAGKAILHGLPDSVRANPLRELVHIYVQAARWGHRMIVHDSVNNMPELGSPFEFLETCAIVYREGCAGVAFRNFFKKGLPMVLENSKFDQTAKVPAVLKQSGELATDFAETMLGLVSQQKYGSRSTHSQQPFPAFMARDVEPAWYQPQNTAYCTCGLHECTCTSDSVSVARPSDTHTIPRRSGYVETAPPSEVSEDVWREPVQWAQHDGGAGWDHLHRPVPRGGIIPGPSMSVFDAESQPMRPRNWSSAHLRQGSDWGCVPPSENGTETWGFAFPAATHARHGGDADSIATGPHVQFRTPSQELVPMSPEPPATTSLEARLREVEKKLSESQLSPNASRQVVTPAQDANSDRKAPALTVSRPKSSALQGTPLATSKMPPAELLHPGLPPVGMPNYIPGYGYNRYVQIGNGVVHPTGPGPYGLAGRTMVAIRDSNVGDCTMVFRSGDVIECVVPVEEGRSTTQHAPLNFSGQRLQGICRTQAGSFPASFAREANAAGPPGASLGHSARPLASPVPPPPLTQVKPASSAGPRTQPATQGARGPGNVPSSTKDKVAGNVDSSWLRSTTSSRDTSQTDPRRMHGTSTPTTAVRVDEHRPDCPSLADWKRPCTCSDQSTPRAGRSGSHAWMPSSLWTNDGWDAPDESMRGF